MQIEPLPDAAAVKSFYKEDYYGCGGSKFVTGIDGIRNLFIKKRAGSVAKTCGGGGVRILDVGCGSGTFLSYMARLGAEGYGTELEGPACERAKQIEGIRVETAEVDESLFPGIEFDAVSIWHVLEHTRDPAAVLASCANKLKSGGYLFLEVPRVESLQARLFGRNWLHLDPPRHLYQLTDKGMREMFSAAGLEVLRIRTGAFEMGAMGALQGALNALIRPRDLLYNMLSTRNRCPGPLSGKLLSIVLAIALAPAAGLFAAAEILTGRGVILRYVCRKRAV